MPEKQNTAPSADKKNLENSATEPSGCLVVSDGVSDSVGKTLIPPSENLSGAFLKHLEKIVSDGGKIRRVWLLRHFPIVNSVHESGKSYLELTSTPRVNHSPSQKAWINKMDREIPADTKDRNTQAVIASILRTVRNDRKILLFSDREETAKIRNEQSFQWIESKYGNILIRKSTNLFASKDSTIGETIFTTAEQLEPIFKDPQTFDQDSVILANRSFAPQFSIRSGRFAESNKDAVNRFESLGYDFLDFEIGENGADRPAKSGLLFVTPENYRTVLELLKKFGGHETEGKISQFFETLPLTVIQEALNATIEETKVWPTDDELPMGSIVLSENSDGKPRWAEYFGELMKEFARVKNSDGKPDRDLQWFAFEQLMKSGTAPGEMIRFPWLPSTLERALSEGYRTFVFQYFGDSKIGPLGDSSIFSKAHLRGMGGIIGELNEYWKICQSQRNGTIDPMIQKGSEGHILDRKIFSRSLKHETGAEEKKDWDFQTILEASKWTKFLLQAPIGEGKSFWMKEFAKHAMLNGHAVKFYKAKDLSVRMFDPGEELSNICDSNPKTLFFFDGLDEMGMERQEWKLCVGEWKGRCVVSTRDSDSSGWDPRFVPLTLEAVDLENFLKSRFQNEPSKADEIRNLFANDRFEFELSGNPLFLSLIAYLAATSEDGLNNGWNFGARPLDKIRNRADLYESVVRLVLSRHGRSGYKTNPQWIEQRMGLLGLFAHELFLGKSTKEIVNGNPLAFLGSLDEMGVLSGDGENEEYEFSHASFYEFFLARHLSKDESGIKEICDMRKRGLHLKEWCGSWKEDDRIEEFDLENQALPFPNKSDWAIIMDEVIDSFIQTIALSGLSTADIQSLPLIKKLNTLRNLPGSLAHSWMTDKLLLQNHLLKEGDFIKIDREKRTAFHFRKINSAMNELQNFTPVIRLIGEVLSNDGNVRNLAKFLGSEGLLNSDSPFETGFYSGLKILNEVPEALRKLKDLEVVLSEYGRRAVSEALEIGQSFIRGCEKDESEEGMLAFATNLNRSYRLLTVRYLFEPALKSENSNAVREALKIMEDLTTAGTFSDTYEKIAAIGSPEALREIIEWVDHLIGRVEFSDFSHSAALRILRAMVYDWDPEWTNDVVKIFNKLGRINHERERKEGKWLKSV